MTTRDPRIDPRAGDIVRNGQGIEFHVRDFDCGIDEVCYQEFGCGELLYADIDEWRYWANGDEIVKRGGE